MAGHVVVGAEPVVDGRVAAHSDTGSAQAVDRQLEHRAVVVDEQVTAPIIGSDVPGMSVCQPSLGGGAFFANLPLLDESGEIVGETSGLQVVLPLEGIDFGEVPHVTFIHEEEAWLADPEEIALGGLDPGTSQVDDYTIDENNASGTATFFERQSWSAWSTGSADSYLVAQGMFEVTCAG